MKKAPPGALALPARLACQELGVPGPPAACTPAQPSARCLAPALDAVFCRQAPTTPTTRTFTPMAVEE